MRIAAILTAAMLSAAPLAAQDLAEPWVSAGTVTVTVGGKDYAMVAPFNTEKNRARAVDRELMGRRNLTMLASAVAPDGKPGSPSLQLTFFVRDGAPSGATAEFFDDQGMKAPLATEGSGSVAFTEFEIAGDGTVTARFEGTLLRMANYLSDPVIAEGAAPEPFSGSMSVTFTRKE